MKTVTDKELLSAARAARERSYSPYSHISVGAALLTRSGRIFTGANIENAAYSPSVCAERVAIFKAIYEGEREFEKIAVVGGSAAREPFPPCGVCRQVMAEFCAPDFEIILESGDGVKAIKLSELLPHSFGKDNLR